MLFIELPDQVPAEPEAYLIEFLLLHGQSSYMPYMAYPIVEGADFGCLQVTLVNSPHPSTGIIVPSEVLKLLRASYTRACPALSANYIPKVM